MQLQDTEFFSKLSKVDQARLLGAMEQIRLRPGEVLFQEGDPGDCLFILTQGSIRLYKSTADGYKHTIAVAEAGAIIGEMAVLTQNPRTTSAEAVQESELFRLGAGEFYRLAAKNSALSVYFMNLLSARLAATNSHLILAESSKLKPVLTQIESLSVDLQKAVLSLSLLPGGSDKFIAEYLAIPDLFEQLRQAACGCEFIELNTDEPKVEIKSPFKEQLKEVYTKKFSLGSRDQLLRAAADYFLSQNLLKPALSIYSEYGFWQEALRLAAVHFRTASYLDPDSMEISMVLADCPEESLFTEFEVFEHFLHTLLGSEPLTGFNKLSLALEQYSRFFNNEQLARLYQLAAEFCDKLQYPQKSLEYINMALSLTSSLGNKQETKYHLARQSMTSAFGMAKAEKSRNLTFQKNRLIGVIPAVAALLLLVCFYRAEPFNGLTEQAMLFIGITVAAVVFWMVNIFPAYVISLAVVILWVLSGVLPPKVALSGFGSTTWLFMVGILALGAAIAKSGLLFRISLHILKLFPKSFRGQLLGLAVAGTAFTPLIPSGTVKTALGVPIAKSIAEAMGLPERGKGSAALGLGAMIYFGYLTPFFLTGSYANIFAMSLVPGGLNVNFFQWLIYALPALIFFAVAMIFLIFAVFRPEQPRKTLQSQTIDEQLKILGKWTRAEIITSCVSLSVIILLIFQDLHHIDNTWIIMAGLIVLVISGIIDNKTLKNDIDWPFLIFIGVALSFVEAIEQLNLIEPVSDLMVLLMQPFMDNTYLFLVALTVLIFLAAFVINGDPAAILFVVSMTPILVKLGIHPWILVFIVSLTAAPFFFPYQSTIYLTAYYSSGEKAFSHRQGRKLALIFSVVTVLAVIISIPFWQYLGLIR